jgi:hypothetical protein
VIQFGNTTFSAPENAGHVDLQVTMAGQAQAPVTIDYLTTDAAGTNLCSVTNGNASLKCDYLVSRGTLTFQSG